MKFDVRQRQMVGATYMQGDPSFSQYLQFNQTYSNDNLNRVIQAVEGSNWGRGFDYDSFGNMWVDPSASRTFGIQPTGNTPLSNVYNSKNQITGSGNYDGNGNQIAVNSASASYDSENHVINTTEPPSMGGYVDNYLYDGNGKRVEKVVNGATIVYVYDAFGDLDAEYTNLSASQITAPCYTPCYLTHDYLGSLRLVTDRRGNVVVARHDYLPFGEEIPAGTGGRTSQWGASNDGNIPTRFTGQMRDLETGLDDFGARYFGAALGRFTSADEPLVDQFAENPQSWNLYSYVRNTPLRNVDPSGNACVYSGSGDTDNSGNYSDDDSGGQSCSEAFSPQQNNTPSTTVTAQQGSWLSAVGTNAFLSFSNAADSYFSFIAPNSQLLSQAPNGGGTAANVGAGIGLAAALIGPGGEEVAAGKEIKVTWKGLLHVLGGHTGGVVGKSAFGDAAEVTSLVKAAESVVPVPQAGGNFERVVDAGRTIGTDVSTGQPTSVYTVIKTPGGELVTAFPGRPMR